MPLTAQHSIIMSKANAQVTGKMVKLTKNSTNEEILASLGKELVGGKVVLYATEDHGIDNQLWGYFYQEGGADPISEITKPDRRCAGPINLDVYGEGKKFELGKAIKMPGISISRELSLIEEKGSSPCQNKNAEAMTSGGQQVYQLFKLTVGRRDNNNGIRFDSSSSAQVKA